MPVSLDFQSAISNPPTSSRWLFSEWIGLIASEIGAGYRLSFDRTGYAEAAHKGEDHHGGVHHL